MPTSALFNVIFRNTRGDVGIAPYVLILYGGFYDLFYHQFPIR